MAKSETKSATKAEAKAETKAPAKAEKAAVMNQYEAMFLLGPIATQEPEKAMGLPRGIIERHGGQIMVIKKWDERKLAYEVGRQKRGTYILAYFTAPGSAVAHIERDVQLSEEVLRVMVTRADHLNKDEMEAVVPQPIEPKIERTPLWEEPRYDRGPRGDRGGDRGDDRGGDKDRAPAPRRPRREDAPVDAPAAAAPAKE